MGKPSEYQVKDISHEIHVSPATKVAGKLRVAGLKRGSKRAEAGKPLKPVSENARGTNAIKSMRADAADAHIWSHPSVLKEPAKIGRKAGLAGAGMIAGMGALTMAGGLHQRKEYQKTHPVRKSSVSGGALSAFGVDHGYVR
jgi:hypothetical protein